MDAFYIPVFWVLLLAGVWAAAFFISPFIPNGRIKKLLYRSWW